LLLLKSTSDFKIEGHAYIGFGWNTLWDGWQLLTQLVVGARLLHQQLALGEM